MEKRERGRERAIEEGKRETKYKVKYLHLCIGSLLGKKALNEGCRRGRDRWVLLGCGGDLHM